MSFPCYASLIRTALKSDAKLIIAITKSTVCPLVPSSHRSGGGGGGGGGITSHLE